MIWIHCGAEREVATTLSLVARLEAAIPDGDILLTASSDLLARIAPVFPSALCEEPPAETTAKVRTFLDSRNPSSLIWVGGPLRPILLRAVDGLKLSAALINARNPEIFPRGSGWLPRAIRTAVAPFRRILTADGATATRLTKGGVDRGRVSATGPILEEPTPLAHDPNELTVMAEALGTRPVWHAADVPTPEIMDMAAAHLAASRKNHRLLLLLSPRDVKSGPELGNIIREAGLRLGVRSKGDAPEPDDQIYITDEPDELGLWCRLAPLTYVGGTLHGDAALSPFDPIALGSAVIHGTKKTPHENRYTRLASADACREVRTAAELGIAVGALISPDRTAQMALAGWEEITRTAESINQLVRFCADPLEANL